MALGGAGVNAFAGDFSRFLCHVSWEAQLYLFTGDHDAAANSDGSSHVLRYAMRRMEMKTVCCALLLALSLLGAGSFEVASIKPAGPDEAGISGEDGRNGLLKMWNVSLKRCIRYAYKIPEDQILGGPKWIAELGYDIVAKADQPASEPDLLTMLQPLLTDRFRLQLHRETRTVPGYTLTVAKGGLKATLSYPNSHSGGNGGRGFIDATASTFTSLTIRLSVLLGRPVVDMTGDNRRFDLHLRWTPDDAQAGTDSAAPDRPSLLVRQKKSWVESGSGSLPSE
jgi:uncharacterized protein (TIGR03435 family)